MREKILSYIKEWERRCYHDGIPDEAPNEIESMVPNYKSICIAILKNDTHLQSLGFSRPKCEAYNILKRIELKNRVCKPKN